MANHASGRSLEDPGVDDLPRLVMVGLVWLATSRPTKLHHRHSNLAVHKREAADYFSVEAHPSPRAPLPRCLVVI